MTNCESNFIRIYNVNKGHLLETPIQMQITIYITGVFIHNNWLWFSEVQWLKQNSVVQVEGSVEVWLMSIQQTSILFEFLHLCLALFRIVWEVVEESIPSYCKFALNSIHSYWISQTKPCLFEFKTHIFPFWAYLLKWHVVWNSKSEIIFHIYYYYPQHFKAHRNLVHRTSVQIFKTLITKQCKLELKQCAVCSSISLY